MRFFVASKIMLAKFNYALKTDHILHVSKSSHTQIGGVESVLGKYVEISKEIFDKVEIIAIEETFGLFWTCKVVNGVTNINCYYQFRIWGHYFSFSFLVLLLISCFKKKIIHTHDPFPLATCVFWILNYRQLIVTYHSDIVKQKFAKALVDKLRLAVLQNAFLITTTSQALKDNSDLLSKLDFRKVTILPLSMSPKSQEFMDELKMIKFNEEIENIIQSPGYFLMIGRMNYYKGLRVLFEALKDIKDRNEHQLLPKIVVAGKSVDSHAKYYSNEIDKLGLDVKRIDRKLTDEEKNILLLNCHSLLFPSNEVSEAFGIIQLEALAFGKTIVNFDLKTGVPWVGKHKLTALTLPLGDKNALRSVLTNKLGEHQCLFELRENCSSHLLKEFSDAGSKEVLKDLYRHAVDRF